MKQILDLTIDEARAAELFRALGNPARVRIVRELARRNTCVTGDLVGVLPLAQSTISEHLKVLKDAGIVQGEVEGQLCYCIDPEVMRWLGNFAFEVGGSAEPICCP